VEAGCASCCRCGYPIEPGTRWHLDHTEDRTGYRGVAHARCNLKAAAERGNTIMRAKSKPVRSREW
jgi:hypothetical protein